MDEVIGVVQDHENGVDENAPAIVLLAHNDERSLLRRGNLDAIALGLHLPSEAIVRELRAF